MVVVVGGGGGDTEREREIPWSNTKVLVARTFLSAQNISINLTLVRYEG